jgi:hypothetical protein
VKTSAASTRAAAVTTRTHFTFGVDTWTPDGESIVEHVVAGSGEFEVARLRIREAGWRYPEDWST